jgi:hypothetical protein
MGLIELPRTLHREVRINCSSSDQISANLNVTNADAKKRILMAAPNPSTSTTTGWPIGFWRAELTAPCWAFT